MRDVNYFRVPKKWVPYVQAFQLADCICDHSLCLTSQVYSRQTQYPWFG